MYLRVGENSCGARAIESSPLRADTSVKIAPCHSSCDAHDATRIIGRRGAIKLDRVSRFYAKVKFSLPYP